MRKVAPYVAIAFALVIAVLFLRNGADWTLEDQQQKVAIKAADSTRKVLEVDLHELRRRTDKKLAADTTPLPRKEVQQIVTDERKACDQVISSCNRQIAERDTRIKTLEKRTSGKLFLVGEGGVAVPLDGHITGARFDAEAGLGFKIDQNLMVEATVSLDRELRVKARKQIKLF